MIRATHSTYTISPPMELTEKLDYLTSIAYLAKDLGQSTLFNQAKEQYQTLANAWYTQARSEADKKSYKTWLGAGETYYVNQPTGFQESIEGVVKIFDMLTKEQRVIALKYLLNTQPCYDIIAKAYSFALKNRYNY